MRLIIALLVILAGCTQTPTGQVTDTPEPIETPQTPIDTSNVVAVVNGEEITTEEVTDTQQMLTQQGQQISQEDALEQTINQELLLQQVQTTLSDEEAEELIERQLSQQGLTLEAFKQQLATQGISYEEQLQALKENLAIQNYLNETIKINVTDMEVRQTYDIAAEQSPDIPPFEQVEPQVRAAVRQQKMQAEISALVQDLRGNASIEYS